jgi:glycosyltransferase involved in cell wall biosynthesis
MASVRSISVVIPSYEHGEWLGGAIESALAQTRPADEVVVVDAGSTDSTADVLTGFGTRIRPFFRGRQGVGATYNAGLAEARCEVVAFLESDDAFEPTYLAETTALLEARPDVDWVSTARRVVDRDGAPTGSVARKRDPSSDFSFERFLTGELGAASTPVARSETLRAVGPFATDTWAADTDMALRFAMGRRMAYLDRPLYRYRRHGGNTSWSHAATVRELVGIIERLRRDHADEIGPRDPLVRKALAKLYGMAEAARMEEDPGVSRVEVLPGLTSALRLHPTSPKHLRRWLLVTLFGPRLLGTWRRIAR